MIPSIEELIQRLQKGEDPATLSWSLLAPEEQAVLQRCALVHTFDRALVSEVLDSQGQVPFERLEIHSLVERVPRFDGLFRLRESARARLLATWHVEEPAFHELNAALAGHFQRKGEGWQLEFLYHLLACRPADAVGLAEQLWEECNQSFDLARCNDLLSILDEREPLLDPKLREQREDWGRYLQTRSLWSDDYIRTARFYERPFLRERLEALLNEEGWILHLYAQGGMGKSMLLRWAIARWCVPLRIPCARIDFDALDPITSTRQPWKILREIARQLDVQLPGGPFRRFIHWLEDYTSSSRLNFEGVLENVEGGSARADHLERLMIEARDRFISVLQENWRQCSVLFILDTVEEALLRPGANLELIVELFEWMHAHYPRLKLIIAGRYNLTERLPKLTERLGLGLGDVQRVRPFEDEEAFSYLGQKRGLEGDPRLEIVVRRSQGSPFKLALFADLLLSDSRLTSEEIAQWPDVDLLYLIERVVERIENPRVRWLLRYGVVPRRLTYTFVEKVMAPFLPEAMAGVAKFDEPSKDALPVKRGEVFRTNLLRSPQEPVDFRALWKELNQYASPFSWVSSPVEQPETLVFHGDVLHPMRRLLQRHEVFPLLHQAAVTYFENRAGQERERWAEFTREAIYHRFQQGDARAAANYWRSTLVQALSSGRPERVHEVSGELLGFDYLDEDGRSRRRADGSPLVLDETLAFANYEFAHSGLDLSRQAFASEREGLLEESELALNRLEQLQAEHGGVSFVDASRLKLLRGAIIARRSPEEALRLAEEAAREAGTTEDRYLAEVFLGEMLARFLRSDEALEHYQVALGLVSKVLPGNVRARLDIQELLVKEAVRAGQLERAREEVERAREMAREFGTMDDQQELAIQRFEIDLQAGEPARGLELLEEEWQQDDWASFGFFAQAWWLKARAQLAVRSPEEAMDTAKDLLHALSRGPAKKRDAGIPAMRARAREVHADVWVAFEEPFLALDELSSAEQDWRSLGEPDGVLRCRARSAWLQLVDLEDRHAAQQTLRVTNRSDLAQRGEGWVLLRLAHAELEDKSENGREARDIVDSLRSSDIANPLTLQVQIALQGLARKHLPTPGIYLELLVSKLEQLPTAAARLALLEPLRNIRLEGPLPPKLVARWLELVAPEHSTKTLSSLDLDGLIQGLRRVEVLRICGLNAQAQSLLEEVAFGLLSAGHRFALRESLLAQDRLGWQSSKLLEALQEVRPFLHDYGGHLTLCAALLIEQAERLDKLPGSGWRSRLGNLLDRAWLVAEADKRLRNLSDVPSRWMARLKKLERHEKLPGDEVQDMPAGLSHAEQREMDARFFGIQLTVSDQGSGRGGPQLQVQTEFAAQRGYRTVESQIPELWEQLESKGQVFSYSLMKRFVSDWRFLGEKLGTALLAPEDIYHWEQSRKVLDVLMRIRELRLAPIPWEFLVASGQVQQHLLSLPEQQGVFYRGSWSDPPRFEEGGHQDRSKVLLLRTVDSGGTRQLPNDQRRWVESAYMLAGMDSIFVHEDLRTPENVIQRAPTVLHICADIDESPSRGEVFFVLDPTRSQKDVEPLSPSRLDRMLKRYVRRDLPVLVVLDVVGRSGNTELATQLFLRNAFAAELFSLGGVAAVLGTGLGGVQEQRYLSAELVNALNEGASVGELACRLRATALKNLPHAGRSPYDVLRDLPLRQVIGPLGTALFTDNPHWVPFPRGRGKSVK